MLADAAALASFRADKYSSASDRYFCEVLWQKRDNLISAKVKFFRDDYDLTILLLQIKTKVKNEEILMQLQLNLFLNRHFKKPINQVLN